MENVHAPPFPPTPCSQHQQEGSENHANRKDKAAGAGLSSK